MHIKGLPRDSTYSRALRGKAAYWDEHVELTAQVLDAIHAQTFYLLKVNGNDPTEPTRTPRPGVGEVEDGTLADFNNLIGG